MLFCLKNCSSDIFFDRFLVCQKIAMIPRLFLPILSAALPIKMSWVFQVMSSSPPRVGDLIAWPPPGPLAHALIATLRQSDGAMAFLIAFTQNKFFAMYRVSQKNALSEPRLLPVLLLPQLGKQLISSRAPGGPAPVGESSTGSSHGSESAFFWDTLYMKGRAKEWESKRQTGCKSLFCLLRSPKCRIETFLVQNDGRFMMVDDNPRHQLGWDYQKQDVI